MLADRKISFLRKYLDPYDALEMVYSKEYPFSFHNGNPKTLKDIIKDFYGVVLAKKFTRSYEVIQDDVVDEINKEREADSYRKAFYMMSRGKGVTVWVDEGKFELIVKVKYYKTKKWEDI